MHCPACDSPDCYHASLSECVDHLNRRLRALALLAARSEIELTMLRQLEHQVRVILTVAPRQLDARGRERLTLLQGTLDELRETLEDLDALRGSDSDCEQDRVS